jgi:Tol biopolymer transport system component
MALFRFPVFPAIHWVTEFGNRPSFSPDGKRIVFQRDTKGGPSSLWIVHRDGKGRAERLYPPDDSSSPSRPDWSWNHRIAFSDQGVIWTIDPDHKDDVRKYYEGPDPLGTMSYPSWYKDTDAIAAVRYYRDDLGAQQADLYQITPAVQQRLTYSPNPVAGRPSVNPDGTRIAFAGNPGVYSQEQNQIWIYNTESKKTYQLEAGPEYQGRAPNWSPQGNLIVFESTRPAHDPTRETPLSLFVIASVGLMARQITLHSVSHPAWSRQQDRIVFDTPEGIGYIDFDPSWNP